MILLIIIGVIGVSITSYGIGAISQQKKCIEYIDECNKQYKESAKAWESHCKAMREHYTKALLTEREKRRQLEAKNPSGEKFVLERTHENEPCIYEEKEKYCNVTVVVSECKKCGHTEIEWYRQEDTEEVEVE